jgi:hypothetical protein
MNMKKVRRENVGLYLPATTQDPDVGCYEM